jgi:hypothetical protein
MASRMTEVNLCGNTKQHSCACAIDAKLSSDIEALLKIPTQGHYASIPVRMDDDILSNISGMSGPPRVGDNDADGQRQE